MEGAGEGSLTEWLLALDWLELFSCLGSELYDGGLDFFFTVLGGVLPRSVSFCSSLSPCMQQSLGWQKDLFSILGYSSNTNLLTA